MSVPSSPCPYCGRPPEVIRVGARRFLARCPCGAFAAYRTPVGVFPAVMRLRKTALAQWAGLIYKSKELKDANRKETDH